MMRTYRRTPQGACAPRILGGVIAVLVACACAGADTTIVLRPEAYVRGPKILLGDVADIQGDNAEALAALELAPAPAPGSAKRFESTLLQARIDTANLAPGARLSGASSVEAKALSLDVTRDQLCEDLRRFIESSMPWDPTETTVDIVPPPQDLVVPEGAVEITWRAPAQYAWAGLATFRGEIRVDGQLKKTVYCGANIDAYKEVVVATEDILRGDMISANRITVEKRPVAKLSQGYLDAPEALEGLVARTTIFAGSVVTKRHVATRQLIKRNDLVVVEAHAGSLVVRTRARALADAGEGDLLRCLNVESKQEIAGQVRKDGVVVLQ